MNMAVTRFPPSFDNNPLTYGFALFSLSLVTAVSMAIIIGWVVEARRSCRIDQIIRNPIPRPLRRGRKPGCISAVTLYRLIVGLLLSTVVSGALPDVAVLLAWGEASPTMMDVLFSIDRICDGALLLPFLVAIFLIARATQVTEHRLALDPVMVKLRPAKGVLREKAKMVGLLLLIAAAVTVFKALPA